MEVAREERVLKRKLAGKVVLKRLGAHPRASSTVDRELEVREGALPRRSDCRVVARSRDDHRFHSLVRVHDRLQVRSQRCDDNPYASVSGLLKCPWRYERSIEVTLDLDELRIGGIRGRLNR